MQTLLSVGILIGAYLLGSIPFGVIIVRLKTGKDIRQVESGRTGGTNAMRAAGFSAGFLTGLMDFMKAAVAVWIARWLLPQAYWLHALVSIAAILGHNYSLFLIERGENGKLRLRGGAGGGPTAGAGLGLWFPSFFIALPVLLIMLFVVGYASLATLSVGVVLALIFGYRVWIGAGPWQYLAFALVAELVLLWALRPNIRRLLKGTERRVGLFARRTKENPAKSNAGRNHTTITL